MPVYLDKNKQPINSPKKSSSLKSINPLLTGRPDTVVGWFNKSLPTVLEKLNAIRDQAKNAVDNQGDLRTSTVENYRNRLEDIEALVSLDTNHNSRLAKIVPSGTGADCDVYLLGFSKISFYGARTVSTVVPILYLSTGSVVDGIGFQHPASIFAPFTPYETNAGPILHQITLESLYNHATDYYLNSDFDQMLINMATNAQQVFSPDEKDVKVLSAYQLFKELNPSITFSNKTLATFTSILMDNAYDKSVMKQLLLQFSELSFASLSSQFAEKAKTFDLL
jgi:hypothetical protein